MPAALVPENGGQVANVLVADAESDAAPAGMRLVAIPEGLPVDSNWSYSDEDGFVDLRPPEPPPENPLG